MDRLPVEAVNQKDRVLRSQTLGVRQLRETVGCWVSHLRERGESPLRLLAAGLLLFAAGLKYLHLTTTPLMPDDSGWQRWIEIGQIEGEIFWGVWLLAGICSRFTRLASVLLFAVFAAFSAYRGVLGHESCGCFGAVKVKPWLAFTLDLLFAGAFLALRARTEPARERAGLSLRRLTAVLIAWALLGITVVLYSSGPRLAAVSEDGEISDKEQVILLDPRQWVGKRFPLMKHLDGGSTFARGRWRLLFVRPGCPHCADVLRQLLFGSPPKSSDDKARWALIELPPLAEDASSPALALPPDIPLGQLGKTKTWLAKVPFTVLLADGIVVGWAPGVSVWRTDHKSDEKGR